MQSFVNKKKMQALQIANCLLQTIYALVVQKNTREEKLRCALQYKCATQQVLHSSTWLAPKKTTPADGLVLLTSK